MAHSQLRWDTPQESFSHDEGDYAFTSGNSASLSPHRLGQIRGYGHSYPLDMTVPRWSPRTEDLLFYARNWSQGFDISDTRNDTIENTEFLEVEQAGITGSALWDPKTAASDPWEARRAEITKLYRTETLSDLMRIMRESGFDRPEHSYKKHFKKWGLKKNNTIRNYAPPSEHVPMSRSASESAQNKENLIQRSSYRSAGAVMRRKGSAVRPTVHTLTVEWERQLNSILYQVENLYLGSIERERWQVQNPFLVQENQHDELLVLVGTGLKSFGSKEYNIMGVILKKAYVALEEVVANCGVFSLPMIWACSRRMIREGPPNLASSFLKYALERAKLKFRNEPRDPFRLILAGLCEVAKKDPERLEDVILKAHGSCIWHVVQKLTTNNLTALQLWSDFAVYMDNREARGVSQAVDHLQTMMQQSGLENDMDDDKILEVQGMSLYVLQANPETAREAEEQALDMLCKVNRRLQKGEKLEGDLRILWKDLKSTLGDFCYNKGELRAAVAHMGECLIHGIEDDRDVLTLKSLEKWYTELGDVDEAERMRNARLEFSQRE